MTLGQDLKLGNPVSEKHYQLVPPDGVTVAEDLTAYRQRLSD